MPSSKIDPQLRPIFDVKPQCYCLSSFDGEGDGMCPIHKARK